MEYVDKKNILRIIEKSGEMKEMLYSVYNYLCHFIKNKEDVKRIYDIIFSMKIIDRKYFMPLPLKEFSYVDSAFPIGYGQTISQPSTVARMLMLLNIKKGMEILEVGSGSGWNASLLAFLTYPGKVISLERYEELTKFAQKNVEELKKDLTRKYRKEKYNEIFNNLKFLNKNIFYFNEGKYDRIIITAGINNGEEKVKRIAMKLLANKGLLLCPYTYGPLLIIKKINKKLKISNTQEEYVFVPLIDEDER